MRRHLIAATVVALLMAIPLGVLAGSGLVAAHLMVMGVAFSAIAYIIGRGIARDDDKRWLPTLLLWAMVAKLAGATARHVVLFGFYEGEGDAVAYHEVGLQVADVWRSFIVPEIEAYGSGSFGTHFVGWLTGLIYAPYEPSSLGGFWIFAMLAFLGQVFLYVAFRSVSTPAAWKRYGLLIFFWPTLLYWPSSIGKEALLIFLLGAGAWGASRLYGRFKFMWLMPIAAAAGMIGLIRIHVAALLVGSILIGAVFTKGPKGAAAGFRRIALVGLGIAAMFPLVFSVAQQFGVSLEGPIGIEDLDPAFSDIETRTEQGGSAVDSGAIRSPADVPAAIVKVLFRPLPNEVSNIQTAAASLEGMLLVGLLIWRLPTMIKYAQRVLIWPYLMMTAAYSTGFVFAWSAINNLGILSRQRSLLLPILLALIVALGWEDSIDERDDRDLSERLLEPLTTPDAPQIRQQTRPTLTR